MPSTQLNNEKIEIFSCLSRDVEFFHIFHNIYLFHIFSRNPVWEELPSMTEISTAAILSYNHIIIPQLEICCDVMQQS